MGWIGPIDWYRWIIRLNGFVIDCRWIVGKDIGFHTLQLCLHSSHEQEDEAFTAETKQEFQTSEFPGSI